jgi:hypothetical protein
MWRSYGGIGMGAALVFNTEFVRMLPDSPIFILKVEYLTAAQRIAWFNDKLDRLCVHLSGVLIPDDRLYYVSNFLFELVRLFGLKFKHTGFREEDEWRFLYMRDRDRKDLLSSRISYKVSVQGIEPCLKIPFAALARALDASWTFESILHQIILGPRTSTLLAQRSVEAMLQSLKMESFIPKVIASTMPFRIHSG